MALAVQKRREEQCSRLQTCILYDGEIEYPMLSLMANEEKAKPNQNLINALYHRARGVFHG